MKRFVLIFMAIGTACGARTTVATAQEAETGEPASPWAAATHPSLLGLPPDEGPVLVRASFQLRDINEIDDAAETFEFGGVLKLSWKDERQAFDRATENVSEKIYQGAFQFNEISPAWYPQVVLVNESGLYETLGVILRVRPDGTSTLVQMINARAEADLDLRRYPFDRHRLDATFEVLGTSRDEVVWETAPDVAMDDEVRIPQWTLTEVRASVGERGASYAGPGSVASTFVVSMDVQRDPFFVIRLVVVPLVLIVMLSWSVFWMERSLLADRISVSFIGILTAVAYQIVVSDIQPDISYVTLMHGFLNLSFFIMCATVVINLWVGALDRRGLSEAGDRIDRRCRWIFPGIYFGLNLVMLAAAFVLF